MINSLSQPYPRKSELSLVFIYFAVWAHQHQPL